MKKRKIWFASILGILAIALVVAFSEKSRNFFYKNSQILDTLYLLQKEDSTLNYKVLESSFFLYKNFDDIFQTQKKIEKIYQSFDFEHIQQNHLELLPLLNRYKKELNQKIKNINDFETVNSAIKNSTIYLATLLNKVPDRCKNDMNYEKLVIEVISSIFLAKNSFDPDFLKSIKKSINKLEHYHFNDQKLHNFHQVLLAHLHLYQKQFPLYVSLLNKILNSRIEKILQKATSTFVHSEQKEIQTIGHYFIILIIFYISAIGYIIYLLILVDKENRKLKKAHTKLELLAKTDLLTKLCNRNQFNIDKALCKKPLLLLVNINGFKNFNDFYGTKVGDFILKKTALMLQKVVDTRYKASFYRIGGDDFGVLIDEREPIDEAKLAQKIIDNFSNQKIRYKDLEFFITVSIGISRTKPLLENADIALKYVKRDKSSNFLLYTEKLNIHQTIETNIQKSKILKDAIESGRILPFFQPIFDNETGKIVKYETLARIKHENRYESIFPYLEIAKELHLYEYITKAIYSQAIDIAKKEQIPISLNISLNDLENEKTYSFLKDLFAQNPSLTHLVTFEILESETLKDYHAIQEFIQFAKEYGCSFAIDDFGSGYSNFTHLYNLDIDYLKIDGSLIKDIDKDSNAFVIVQHIHSLAKDLGLKTVAEFVHSKEVYAKVKEIGIDYSQGFYLCKPKPIVSFFNERTAF